MDTWMGLMVALFALFAIFVLYVGGVAVVLRLIEMLLPPKDAQKRELSAPTSAS